MAMLLEDVPRVHGRTDFRQDRESMAKKKAAPPPMGRPRAIKLTPEQLEYIAKSMQDSAIFLLDTAKHMRENELPHLTLPAAKMLDEHLPAAMVFCRRAFSECGPAVAAWHMGRKTRLELNQEKHDNRKRRNEE